MLPNHAWSMWALVLGLLGGLCPAFHSRAEEPTAPTAHDAEQPARVTPLAAFEGEEIRDRLTEREDENRVEDPFTLQLWGYRLSLMGEYEVALQATDQIVLGDPPEGDDRLVVEQEIETEAFYTLGEPLSILLQTRFIMEYDTLHETRDGLKDFFVERGEMWLLSEDVLGSGLDVEVGRLEFDDDRGWWWDEDLDAVRVTYEPDAFDAELSVAYELGPTRSDQWYIDPEQDERLRIFAEVSLEPADDHALEFFFLFDKDFSDEHHLGARMKPDREDDSDARLLWVGPRAIGGFDVGSGGIFAYWIDAAWVTGRETLLEFEPDGNGRLEAVDVDYRKVSGWGVDLGLTYFSRLPFEPRATLGFAMGSGDSSPDSGKDRAFRQTGLFANETGYGGVQRFNQYGRLLEPELSNLQVFSAGVGISLFRTSSADLVYHYYRLVEPAAELRESRLATAFNGRDHRVGQSLGLTVAIEEGERFEFEFSGSVFRAGDAWGSKRGDWAFGGFGSFRFAF